MGFLELLLLAVGLSMDAFAVSLCKGLSVKKAGLRERAICGAWFGGFQGLMPLIGFFFGTLFAIWFVSSMELEGADVSKTSSAGSTSAVDDIN